MSYSFDALEGRYQSCNYEPCHLDRQLQMNHFEYGNVAVHLSFLDFPCNERLNEELSESVYDNSLFCINVGNDIRLCSQDNGLITDRRFINGSPTQIKFKVPPTSHSFRKVTDKAYDSQLLVGHANGEIKIIDPLKDDVNKVYNESKAIDETSVTCVSWVPHSPNQFLVSHSSGFMYLYDETLAAITTPSYTLFKQGIGFSVYTCKTKSTRNPLYKWTFGNHIQNTTLSKFSKQSSSIHGHKLNNTSDSGSSSTVKPNSICSLFEENNASINQFSFSPCGRYIALVSEDGYLRVVEYHKMELHGFMKSYFGALLCVDWSPDSLYIVTGGQDDLITIWSVIDRAVICRGQGHKSWVSMVRFDPFLYPIQDNNNTTTTQDDQYSSKSVKRSQSSPIHDSLSQKANSGDNDVSIKTYRMRRSYRAPLPYYQRNQFLSTRFLTIFTYKIIFHNPINKVTEENRS